MFYSSSNRNNKQYSLHMFVYQVKSTVGFCSLFASVVSSCVIWIQTLVVVNLSHHMISTVDRAIVIILRPSSSSVNAAHFNFIPLQITWPLWTKLGIRFLLQTQLFEADNASWIDQIQTIVRNRWQDCIVLLQDFSQFFHVVINRFLSSAQFLGPYGKWIR